MMRSLMLPVYLSSIILAVSCAHDDTPSLRMLDARADYQASEPEAQTLALATAAKDEGSNAPVRLPPKIANIWMHAHETSEREYFWGGWLSVVVAGESWDIGHAVAPLAPVATAGSKLSKKAKK